MIAVALMSAVSEGFLLRGSWIHEDPEDVNVLESEVVEDCGGITSNVCRTRAMRSWCDGKKW